MQAVGRWIDNLVVPVRFPFTAAVGQGLSFIDLIIDRTKKTGGCAEIAEILLKGTLNPNNHNPYTLLYPCLLL